MSCILLCLFPVNLTIGFHQRCLVVLLCLFPVNLTTALMMSFMKPLFLYIFLSLNCVFLSLSYIRPGFAIRHFVYFFFCFFSSIITVLAFSFFLFTKLTETHFPLLIPGVCDRFTASSCRIMSALYLAI